VAGIEKTIDKMKRQPNGVSYEEAAKVLEHFGYKFVRQKGSHCHFRHENGDLITVKKDTPTIKKCYVVDILSRIGE
jgi:predicted RNA binding protein YcfA (HicA-like mRNA interferase family)